MKQLSLSLFAAVLLVTLASRPARAAYDDVNIEEGGVIEKREQMQEEHQAAKKAAARERKTLPDEVVETVQMSRLNVDGNATELEDEESAEVRVVTLGKPANDQTASASVASVRGGTSRTTQLIFIGVIGLVVFVVVRRMPKDAK